MTSPILAYISKKGCPACGLFDPVFMKLADSITDMKLVKFELSPGKTLLDEIKVHVHWYPTVMLIDSESYYTLFTQDDKLKPNIRGKKGFFKCMIYGTIQGPNGPLPVPGAMTYDNLSRWVKTNRSRC